jgi:uncharacterized protein
MCPRGNACRADTEHASGRVDVGFDVGSRAAAAPSNPVCRKCRYAVYCGGGCAVLAEGQHGAMHTNHCDGFGKRFRASVADAYQDHVAGTTRAVTADRVCDM